MYMSVGKPAVVLGTGSKLKIKREAANSHSVSLSTISSTPMDIPKATMLLKNTSSVGCCCVLNCEKLSKAGILGLPVAVI